ncbi:4-hydroxy-tetrahydrodipicolinate reductase [bacterium]|nr:MAG: 4-hydroxy-tetrahydrodipicolinate reductase [bacterium]
MKFIVSGILGKMGKSLVEVAESSGEFIVAGTDEKRSEISEIPVYSDVEDLPTNVDCAIDFSSPAGAVNIARWCEQHGIPLVCGTTGLDSNDMKILTRASKKCPLYYASNMSIAVALLMKFAEITAKILPESDVEIIEMHHSQKRDAPSGTALSFAKKILSARGLDKDKLTFGRSGHTGTRPSGQIGIHSVRAGKIVGEHQIIFALPEEEIIFTHRAEDRKLFARGAINIARWLIRKPAGFYTPAEFISSKLEV